MSFKERLRATREERGWSLGRLATESNVSKGYLSQLEAGLAEHPGLEVLVGIADALGVSLDWLVRGVENETRHVWRAAYSKGWNSCLARLRTMVDDVKPLPGGNGEL